MRKSVIISLALFAFENFTAQVDIITTIPNGTLGIAAKNTDGTSVGVDGLLIPRLDRERAQSMIPNSIPESTPYYFFNGSVWVKLNNNLLNTKE